MERLRIFRGDGAFGRARAAKVEGLSVCGTWIQDKPVYFLAPDTLTDEEMRDLAFEIANGRKPGPELQLLDMARAKGLMTDA